jgi:hypothetical protein
MSKPAQASSILAHPMIQEFFKQLHEQVYQGIKKAKTAESREELAAFGRYADEFQAFFKAYMETGEMEDLQKREADRLAQVELDRMKLVRERYNW